MRFLITGVAGFLGSNLAERLLLEGHEVIGVDDFSTGQLLNLSRLEKYPNFSFLKENVIRPLEIKERLDWIMHLASPASPPKYLRKPIETLLVNAEGTRHLLDLSLKKGAAFFLASTSEVYGDPLVHPQSEAYWGNVNPIGPRSVYDEGKRYAEALTVAYHRVYGLPVRIARIFNTYGPGMSPEDGRVVSSFIIRALEGKPLTVFGDGTQTRSFCYVEDIINGFRRLLEVDYPFPVNLGNPEEYRILDLALMIKELTGSSSPIAHHPLPQDDPKQRRPDISLARRLLDWEPKVPLKEGLLRTIKYFQKVRDGLG